MVHGIKANAKLFIGMDEAPPEVQKYRWNICRECPKRTVNKKYLNHPCKGLTALCQCIVCACPIGRKTKLQSEKCPEGKW